MVKILSIVGTLSGSINGTTYSHNKGGAYIRKRSIPTVPASGKQTAARALLAFLSAAWSNSLSATQQTEWNDWAAVNPISDALGQSIQLTGHQAFVSLNARVVGAGGTFIHTSPVVTAPAPLLTLVVTATAPTTISAAFTTTPLAAGLKLALWMCLPTLPGSDPNVKQSRLIGYSAAAAASPATYVSPYPFLSTQAVNFWGAVLGADGQVSQVIKNRVIVP